jgi:hypothetical protein
MLLKVNRRDSMIKSKDICRVNAKAYTYIRSNKMKKCCVTLRKKQIKDNYEKEINILKEQIEEKEARRAEKRAELASNTGGSAKNNNKSKKNKKSNKNKTKKRKNSSSKKIKFTKVKTL